MQSETTIKRAKLEKQKMERQKEAEIFDKEWSVELISNHAA